MDNEDRVGFIRFNHNVYVVFELSERGKNHVYLRYSIQASKESFKTGGETAFFAAIFEGLKLFKNAGITFYSLIHIFIIVLIYFKRRNKTINGS